MKSLYHLYVYLPPNVTGLTLISFNDRVLHEHNLQNTELIEHFQTVKSLYHSYVYLPPNVTGLTLIFFSDIVLHEHNLQKIELIERCLELVNLREKEANKFTSLKTTRSLIQIQVSYPGTVIGKVLSAVSRKLHIIDSLKFT